MYFICIAFLCCDDCVAEVVMLENWCRLSAVLGSIISVKTGGMLAVHLTSYTYILQGSVMHENSRPSNRGMSVCS